MTTWTPASSTSESWVSTMPGRTVFDPTVFAHDSHGGKFVFAFSNADGGAEGWHKRTSSSEGWTAA